MIGALWNDKFGQVDRVDRLSISIYRNISYVHIRTVDLRKQHKMSALAGLQDHEILVQTNAGRKPKREEAGIDFEGADSTIRQPSPRRSSCKPYISGLVQTDYKSDTKLAR